MLRSANRAAGRSVVYALWGLVILMAYGNVRSAEAEENREKVVLVIHGGAGVLTQAEMKGEKTDKGEPLKRGHFEQALVAALESGYKTIHQQNKTSVDAVEAAIRSMEDSGLFNAGRGAAFSHDG